MMTFTELKTRVRSTLSRFDALLLVFMLVMSQDRIVVKLAAIVLIFLLRRNFDFRLRAGRLPLFFLAIIALEVLKWLFMGHYYLGNWATLLVSSLYWMLAFLTMHQTR